MIAALQVGLHRQDPSPIPGCLAEAALLRANAGSWNLCAKALLSRPSIERLLRVANQQMLDPKKIEEALQTRSGGTCELCKSTTDLSVFEVPPVVDADADRSVLVCATCKPQLGGEGLDATHLFCLQDSIWSEVDAVKVVSWRLLHALPSESWAQDLLDQAYMEDETMYWAKSGMVAGAEATKRTVDSNGSELVDGDSISLIKDLDVKGSTFTAKRGTLVKNIRLTDNPEHVEGRVNKVVVVLKTCFVKKTS